MGEAAQAQRHAQGIVQHTERPCGTEEFREGFQEVVELVLGTKEERDFQKEEK